MGIRRWGGVYVGLFILFFCFSIFLEWTYLSIFTSVVAKDSASSTQVFNDVNEGDPKDDTTSIIVDVQYGDSAFIGNPPLKESAVVVVGCRRLDNLLEIMSSLLKQEQIGNYSLYVSLGCVEAISKKDLLSNHLLSRFTVIEYHDPPFFSSNSSTFLRIQLHYQFFLHELFEVQHHRRVIVLEDDLSISPSFLQFFESTFPLFDQDPSIACISAFNDHALEDTDTSTVLRRTSFFPNLALMFTDRTYSILWKDQPLNITTNGWDHWLRIRASSLHMECVYPAVPRVRHRSTNNSTTASGAIGKKLAKYPMVQETNVPMGDLSYIQSDLYDRYLLSQFLEPQQVNTAVELLKEQAWSYMGTNKTLPRFIPQYQSDVVVMVAGVDKAPRARLMKGKKVLFLVTRELFTPVAAHLKLFRSYRGFHHGILPIKLGDIPLFFIDRRQWVLVPPEYAILPNSWGKIVKAEIEQDCHVACSSHDLICDNVQLEFINRCEVMKQYFGCEKGCWNEVANYIPSYVTHGEGYKDMCFVSPDTFPLCESTHPNTQRLCYCIPRDKRVDYKIKTPPVAMPRVVTKGGKISIKTKLARNN